MTATLAIDIGGTKFSLAAFVDGAMVRRATRPTDRAGGPKAMIPQIVAIARHWQRDFAFGRCGVGFGGPVDFASQRVVLSTHVEGWGDFPLVPSLQAGLGLPVVMDNDANVGALGEAFYGAGRGCDPLFYMTLSTGIGGGIVTRGDVLRGADSYAGEIGHLTIRPDGPQCLCGWYGCFERLCCGLWLERDHGQPAWLPQFLPKVLDLAALASYPGQRGVLRGSSHSHEENGAQASPLFPHLCYRFAAAPRRARPGGTGVLRPHGSL